MKKLSLTLAALVLSLSLIGCDATPPRPVSHRFEVVSAEKTDGDWFEIYRDTQTSVEYLDFNGKSLIVMPEDAQHAQDLQTYEQLKKKLGK